MFTLLFIALFLVLSFVERKTYTLTKALAIFLASLFLTVIAYVFYIFFFKALFFFIAFVLVVIFLLS